MGVPSENQNLDDRGYTFVTQAADCQRRDRIPAATIARKSAATDGDRGQSATTAIHA